jgi:hypothetical protein
MRLDSAPHHERMRLRSAASPLLGALLSGLVAGCPQDLAPPPDAGNTGVDAGLDAFEALDAYPDVGGPPQHDTGASYEDELRAAGFEMRPGSLALVEIGDCCAEGRSCSGNNPSSPYAAVRLGRGPGQTEPNPNEDARETSTQFFLRSDEAVVLVGQTPPTSRYFGFTPYLMSRPGAGGMRSPIFASLSETVNQDVIEVQGAVPFDARTAIIFAADQATADDVRQALVRGAYPAVNVVVLDPAVSRFGLDASADDFGILMRLAFPDDAARANAWLASPPMVVHRLSRITPGAFRPLPSPVDRPKDPDARELALEAAVDRLEAAIRSANASASTIRELAVTDGDPDPAACISTPRFCAGDNRDTVYPATGPFFLGRGDSLYIFGVDHDVMDKATYHSCSVYALDHLVGLRSVTSLEWAGSAERFLPGDPDAASLFAWRVARDCAGDAYCLEIPVGSCPDGAPLTGALALAFRAYVEPATATAPDPATLVRERALLVR